MPFATSSPALELLENGLALSKEQFGLEALIHPQMGAMHYQLAGMSYQQKSVAEMQRQSSEVSRHTKRGQKALSGCQIAS